MSEEARRFFVSPSSGISSISVNAWPKLNCCSVLFSLNTSGVGVRGDTHVEKESKAAVSRSPRRFDSGRSDRRLTGGVSLRADGLRS